jgi:hypothetical protein
MDLIFQPGGAVASGRIHFSIEVKDYDEQGDRTNCIGLFGWCISTTGKIVEVEFYIHEMVFASTKLNVPRPDVLEREKRKGLQVPLYCGFHLRISKFILPGAADIQIKLWEDRGTSNDFRINVGSISNLPISAAAMQYAERYQPLLLLGMGRSGTSYTMNLLSKHTGILVPGSHPYEMREPVWLWQAANVLSAPFSLNSMSPDGFESESPQWLGFNPYRSRGWEKSNDRMANAIRWQEDRLPIACIDFFNLTESESRKV